MRRLSILAFLPACWWGDNTVIPFDALVEGDPPTTTASPAAGVYRDEVTAVTLTADEDANIYYTLDGSTPSIESEHGPSPVVIGTLDESTEIRYFAQDRDSDREPEHATAYLIDRLGPPPVAGLATSYAGFGLDVRWTAPAEPGLVEVVVAETTDVAATIPAFGATLAVDDAVGAGTVVYVGAGDHVTIDPPTIGSHTFVAWAHYDTGTFSEARVTSVYVDAAAELAHLTLDTGTPGVVAMIQPAHATVAVSAVSFNAGTLTFDVTTTSGFAGLTYNPMLVASNVTGGTLVGDGTITLDADYPYFDLGPEAWAEDAAVTRTITITGANGTVELDLDIRHTAGVFAARCACGLADPGGFLIDRAVGTARVALPRPPNGFDGEQLVGTLVVPDGRHVLAGTILPSVIAIDPTDGTVVDTIDINGATGVITALRLDPSGQRLYALFEEGTFTQLIELDPGTLDERGRITLDDSGGSAPALDLSRDGRWAAVIANDRVHVIDLSAFAVRDADPTAAGAQAIAPPTDFHPNALAFDAAAGKLIVNSGVSAIGDQIGIVDLTEATLRFAVFDIDGDPLTSPSRVDGFVAIVGGLGGFYMTGELLALTRFNAATNMFDTFGTAAHESIAGRIDKDGNLEILSPLDLGKFSTATGAYTSTAPLPVASCDRTLAITPY